jgi:hypothetical protein
MGPRGWIWVGNAAVDGAPVVLEAFQDGCLVSIFFWVASPNMTPHLVSAGPRLSS